MLKNIKLVIEGALLISFVSFFVGMFFGAGRWLGICAGLVFTLLPVNFFLGNKLHHKNTRISKGGIFIFLFMFLFGIFAIYMSIIAE